MKTVKLIKYYPIFVLPFQLSMKKLVVLTGSGISSESGLKTFRDSGGLWENYDVMEVASPEGWEKNRETVLKFYNERRAQLKDARPNEGHKELVDLEKYFEVYIITQNVDNLHERAGSSRVLHLHGIYQGKDHYDISSLNEIFLSRLFTRLTSECAFEQVVTIEVFNKRLFEQSIEFLNRFVV
jgi:hypothetical protein